YRYGWDGLRVARTTGAQTSTYLWAAGALVEERLAGQPALLYTQGGGMTVAVGAERIAHDGMGSAVGRYPATGAGTRQQYDAWGAHRNGTAPTSAQASLGYTGHAYDAESGLTYAQQRWLDTGTGRFLSEDPVGAGAYLGAPQGLNPWLYANGNPTRYTDPDGRIANLGAAGIGALIGGVGGCAIGAWNAADGDGWSGCGKGLLVGGAAGGVAGLTFGASLAAMGVTATGAQLTTGTVLTATGAKVAVAGAAAGATGGFTGGFLGTDGDLSDRAEAGLKSGAHGAVVGAVAAPALALASGYGVLATTATAVSLDAADQGVSRAAGWQEGWDWSRTATAGLLTSGVAGSAKLHAKHQQAQANARVAQSRRLSPAERTSAAAADSAGENGFWGVLPEEEALFHELQRWEKMMETGTLPAGMEEPPAAIVAAINKRTGDVVIGVSGERNSSDHPDIKAGERRVAERIKAGQLANLRRRNVLGCAESNAACKLLADGGADASLTDIRFTDAYRPRTGERVPVCANCSTIHGNAEFPGMVLRDPQSPAAYTNGRLNRTQ
ncbi:RHS repeat-associated core domain-containing protein, partial [Corallococcus sicarius]